MTVAELTTDAIDAMPAGREMDALLYKKVFGHRVEWRDDEVYEVPPNNLHFGTVLIADYSTNITAAMEAAELFPEFSLRRVHWADKMRGFTESGTPVSGTHGELDGYRNGWWAAATREGDLCSFAETAPLVICRTILINKISCH